MSIRLLSEPKCHSAFLEQTWLKHSIKARIEFLHPKQIDSSEIKAEKPLFFIEFFVCTLQCDFLTKPVLTWRGIKHQTVLVFMHIASRKIIATGAIEHPNNEWMCKVAECFPSMVNQLGLDPPGILVMDNDVKFTREFDDTLKREGITLYPLPLQSPLMNAHIERWIKSLKSECLDHFIPVGTKHLDYLIGEYVEHYHYECPHQGLENKPIMPTAPTALAGKICCDTRLGGLLRHYRRAA